MCSNLLIFDLNPYAPAAVQTTESQGRQKSREKGASGNHAATESLNVCCRRKQTQEVTSRRAENDSGNLKRGGNLEKNKINK